MKRNLKESYNIWDLVSDYCIDDPYDAMAEWEEYTGEEMSPEEVRDFEAEWASFKADEEEYRGLDESKRKNKQMRQSRLFEAILNE